MKSNCGRAIVAGLLDGLIGNGAPEALLIKRITSALVVHNSNGR